MLNARDTKTGKTIDKNNLLRRIWSTLLLGGKKALRIIVGRTLPQKLFRLYIIIIVVGALFLSAPFCLQKIEINGELIQINGFTNSTGNAGGADYTFVQALFIACSGFSDTGLTPISIYQYLNVGGQVVLLILIEIGGIGVVALFYYVWNFFKKKDDKIDVGQLYIMQAERGGSKLSESYRVIKSALFFIITTQIVFMFAFSFCFCYIPAYEQRFIEFPPTNLETAVFKGISFDTDTLLPMYHNYPNSLWIGLFTTVSAMNNAGFDNISSNSMAPFRNDWGLFLQALIIIELIIGGLGHFVWFDIIEKIKCKATGKRYKMTLYSKVAITVYLLVALFGLIGAFCFEFLSPSVYISRVVYDGGPGNIVQLRDVTIVGNRNLHNEFGQHEWLNKCFAIVFQTFNCRSLGMETVKTNVFTEGSKWVLLILMFIGASPCSTAGGIRTTTLAVIIVTIWCKLCGRKNVFFFKRRISQDTVTQAFIIFFLSLLILLIGAIVLWTATPVPPEYSDYPNYWFSFSELLLECSSAFGTVGLSAGVTSLTKWWGLLYLVFLMFVGQLGVINTLLSWTKFYPRFNDIQYPYEDIKIG